MHAAFRTIAFALAAAAVFSCGGDNKATGPTQSDTTTSFFVTSSKSTTGNLGGLRGADALCQSLANTAGAGNKTWRAYLSVERDADNGNPNTRRAIQQRLAHWQEDTDFTAVRDVKALAALPEKERAAWQKFWADVAALRRKCS